MVDVLPVGVWVREWRARRGVAERPWRPGYRPVRVVRGSPGELGCPEPTWDQVVVEFGDGKVYRFAVPEGHPFAGGGVALARLGVSVNRFLVLVPGLWVLRER